MIIKGNTVGTPMPRTNYEQTDPSKADYLKGKDVLDRKIEEAKQAGLSAAGNAQSAAGTAQTAANAAQASANAAQATADGAVTAAGNAQATADGAQTAANNAQASADNAQTAAGNAQATADNALNLAAIEDDAHTISSNADLNNYVTPGAYRCATATIAATLANGPSYTGAGFRLIVSSTSSDGGIVHFAIFNTTGNPRIFWRIRNSSGTWSEWVRAVGHDVGTNVELWTGSWASGTITVPDTSAYKAFLIAMESVGTMILAIRYDEHIRGIGGYSTSAPVPTSYQFAATYEGDKWKFVACNSVSHTPNGNHGAATSRTITRVIGYL